MQLKKVLSIILVAVMLLSVLPFTASAASEPYLTFIGTDSFSIKTKNSRTNWSGTLEYSTDTNTWTTWDGTSQISSDNNVLYLRGTGNTKIAGSSSNYWVITTQGTVACSGDIRTLLDYNEPESSNMGTSCFSYLFKNCTSLTAAPELPATILASSCYEEMFNGCINLTTAPELPATALAKNCYRSMFQGCTSLTTAPELPATALANYCYFSMFQGCANLTTAPELWATSLASYCYQSMFNGCANLTTAPELPATALAPSCYFNMFKDCINLTTAPELPATTMTSNCYRSMFQGCTGIKLSTEQTAEYSIPYSIPKEGTGSMGTYTAAMNDMFTDTGGTFTGTPTINTTYYIDAPAPAAPTTGFMVGDDNYTTLDEAIAAAQAGDTVTFLEDVTVDSPVVVAAGKDIKLDLDGHSLSGNIADADGKKLIQVSGKLEFVGENGGCIYNTNVAGQGHAACQALTGGTVIVNAPIHFGDSDTDMTNANSVNRGCGIQNNGGTLIINDGYYTAIDANYSAGAWAYAILNCAGDTTVNNATVYGVGLHGALGCEEGTFTVNGGTFAVNGANNYYSLYCDGGDFTVNGGTFTNSSKNGVNYVGANSSTTITGGDFTYSATTPFVQKSSKANPVVSGGTFSAVVPENCCAPGFEPVTEPNAQGKYEVEVKTPNNGVSLTVGDDITSNYYVDYSAYAGATKIVYTYNAVNEYESKEAVTKTISLAAIPAEMLDNGRIKITVSQAPAQMAEETEIKVMKGDEVLDTLNYSSKTYCDNIIAMDDDTLAEYAGSSEKAAQLKTLCNTIIAYGFAAQGVFTSYGTNPIASTAFSDAVQEQIAAASCAPGYSVNNAGQIRFKSIVFACTKDARLRFYLDVSGATSTPAAPTAGNGRQANLKYVVNGGEKRYYVEVGDIDAVDFDEQIIVNYGGSRIACSVLDFCGLVLTSNTTEAMQEFAKTLIVYNTNAQAYFG